MVLSIGISSRKWTCTLVTSVKSYLNLCRTTHVSRMIVNYRNLCKQSLSFYFKAEKLRDIHDEDSEIASTSNNSIEYYRIHPKQCGIARVRSVAGRGDLTALRARKGHNLNAITQRYGEDKKT